MTRFVVESATPVDPPAGLSRNEHVDFMKTEVGKLVGVIEAYNAAAQDNRVEVKDAAWINTTVLIEASEEAAQKLAVTTGLKVEKPRRITRE